LTTKRVLLFGASGYLGGQVTAALLRDDRTGEIVRVGRRVPDEPGWVRHDLVTDTPEDLAALIRTTRPDAVISCAGRLTGSTVDLVLGNVLTTARLVDAVTAEAPAARLVVLGSAAEYGVVPVGRPVTEDSHPSPVAVYGTTKLASTQLIRLATTEGRLNAVSLRVFNPIGPGMPTETLLGRAAAAIRTALESGADHIQLGPLDPYRDFVDVRDVATAVAAAALTGRSGEPVLNVGSGVAVTAREAVRLLAETAGFTGEIQESDPPPARSSAVTWIAADLTRVTHALDWTPQHALPGTVQAIWNPPG
jgi:NDP-hexose 4-ketoreductase